MGPRTDALVLAVVAFLSSCWLTPQFTGNDQVVTRLALTLGIIEQHTLSIDRFADRTVDKAEFAGHAFADKAPGLSLLAIPAVAAARAVLSKHGVAPDARDRGVFERYATIATIATNGIASTVAVVLLYFTALRLGAGQAGARFGAAALAVGTPFLGWTTAFFAHALAGSLLAAIGAVSAAAYAGPRPWLRHLPFLLGLISGALMGLAVTVDFTAAPLAAIIGLIVLLLAFPRGFRNMLHLLGGLTLGGLVGVLPLLVYNRLAFGAPLTIGYSEVQLFTGMKQGFYGLTWPDLPVAHELLFGDYRGLLPLAPVLALVPAGLLSMLGQRGARLAALIVLASVVTFLWINASYVYWKGGNATGPRFLTPMLPFAALAVAFAWPARGWLRIGVMALLILSAMISVLCAGVSMFAPEDVLHPMRDYLLPRAPEASMKMVPVLALWMAAAIVFMLPGRARLT
jgi:hypothetical protein